GRDPSIPEQFRLPKPFRLDVRHADDDEILSAVAALVEAYLQQLIFLQDEQGEFDGSPYDQFLKKNGLPRQPRHGESDLEYARHLRHKIDHLDHPAFITGADGALHTHAQAFVFGAEELAVLKLFLAEPGSRPGDREGIGNC